MQYDRDRGLLFGVLAVQLKGVSPAQLVEAAAAWAADPSVSLAQRLVDKGLLTERARTLLERLTEEAVRAHNGDAAATLDSLGIDPATSQNMSQALDTAQLDAMQTALMTSLGFSVDDGNLVSGVEEVPGRYTIISQHARGGMGRVLLVHDETMSRDIAMKELMPFRPPEEGGGAATPVRQTASLVARFLQEARITGQLEHPSIVPVYELGRRADGTLYYTMKLVRGRTLGKAIKECGGLEQRLLLLPNFVDLCQAIAYAHDRRIIHRDIKPANVMVGSFGETVVIDWGLAKLRDSEDINREEMETALHSLELDNVEASPKTAYGKALGTPNYMPPEQAEGRLEVIDERSDVYSLGAVLYELLTGETPYAGKTTREVIQKVIATRPKPVGDVCPDVPAALAGICAKAMEREPVDRYQSVGELADDIERFTAGSLVRAYKYSMREVLVHAYRKHRAIVHTAGLVLLAFCTVCTYSYLSVLRARDQEHAQRLVAEEARQHEAAAREEVEHTAYLNQLGLIQEFVANRDYTSANRIAWQVDPAHRRWEWGLLINLANPEYLRVQTPAPVQSVAFSADGRLLATTDSETTVRLWDMDSGENICTCEGNVPATAPCVFSPDGRLVAAPAEDLSVYLWDTASGRLAKKLAGHQAPVTGFAFTPDGTTAASTTENGMVCFWDTREWAKRGETRSGALPLHSPEFSRDGKTLVTSENDATARVWLVPSGTEAFQCPATGVARFTPDGTLLATASANQISLWAVPSGAPVSQFAFEHQTIRVAFAEDSSRMLAAAADGSVRLWMLPSGEIVRDFRTSGPLLDASLLRDQYVVASLTTNEHEVWELTKGSLIARVAAEGRSLWGSALSSTGLLAVTAQSACLQVWNPLHQTGCSLLAVSDGNLSPDAHLAADQNGTHVAILDGAGVRLCSTEGQEASVLFAANALSGGAPPAAATAADNSRLAMVLDYFVPMLWTEANQSFVQFFGHDDTVNGISLDPVGRKLLTASGDMTAKVWDADSGTPLRTLAGHTDSVLAARWSPDSQKILTASFDGTAILWDANSGEKLRVIANPDGALRDAVFSPDGSRIYTASRAHHVGVWEAASGKALAPVGEHCGALYGVSIAETGRLVASLSFDGTARLWEAKTGAPLLRFADVSGFRYIESTAAAVIAHKDLRIEQVAPFHSPGSNDEKATSEEAFRRLRAQEHRKALKGSTPAISPKEIVLVASGRALKSVLASLVSVLESEKAAGTPDFDGQGVQLTGARARGIELLGLLPGDTLVEWMGTGLERREKALALLKQAVADLGASGESDREIRIRRCGQALPVHLHTRECRPITKALTLDSDRIAGLIEGLTRALTQGEAVTRGQEEEEALAALGFGLRLETNQDTTGAFARAGLMKAGRLVSINGTTVRDYAKAQELLNAVKQTATRSFEMEFQRGSFVLARVVFSNS